MGRDRAGSTSFWSKFKGDKTMTGLKSLRDSFGDMDDDVVVVDNGVGDKIFFAEDSEFGDTVHISLTMNEVRVTTEDGKELYNVPLHLIRGLREGTKHVVFVWDINGEEALSKMYNIENPKNLVNKFFSIVDRRIKLEKDTR
eukprot:TRINITY_DN13020_c0_g1_i1.p1 TRINITY_DN13020_c0_g1~~TRINITY_DN13020_c0_g1_i1.p1  ORF type:complete len:155 (+),score=11.53 TRINITY_DN13020_c0_g1_i1:42-467(+)